MSKLSSVWKYIQKHKYIKYIVVVVCFALYICFIDENNYYKSLGRRKRIVELKKELDDYKARYHYADSMLNLMNHSPKTTERMARELYYMKREGEDVFVIKSDDVTGNTDSLANDTL